MHVQETCIFYPFTWHVRLRWRGECIYALTARMHVGLARPRAVGPVAVHCLAAACRESAKRGRRVASRSVASLRKRGGRRTLLLSSPPAQRSFRLVNFPLPPFHAPFYVKESIYRFAHGGAAASGWADPGNLRSGIHLAAPSYRAVISPPSPRSPRSGVTEMN